MPLYMVGTYLYISIIYLYLYTYTYLYLSLYICIDLYIYAKYVACELDRIDATACKGWFLGGSQYL